MLPLYIGLIVISLGVGYVAWLMWNEESQNAAQIPSPEKKASSSENESRVSLLNKILANKIAKKFSFRPAPSSPGSPEPIEDAPAAMGLDEEPVPETPSLDSPEGSSEQELQGQLSDLESQVQQLQEKYNKLNTMFDEKSVLLTKTEQTLANELKTRKEFNKVRDLLEKELKASKDKCRNLKIEVTTAQTEAQNHKKRIDQLEEKIQQSISSSSGKEQEVVDAQTETEKIKAKLLEINKLIETKQDSLIARDEDIRHLVNLIKDLGPEVETEEESPETENEVKEPASQVIASEPPLPPQESLVAEASPDNIEPPVPEEDPESSLEPKDEPVSDQEQLPIEELPLAPDPESASLDLELPAPGKEDSPSELPLDPAGQEPVAPNPVANERSDSLEDIEGGSVVLPDNDVSSSDQADVLKDDLSQDEKTETEVSDLPEPVNKDELTDEAPPPLLEESDPLTSQVIHDSLAPELSEPTAEIEGPEDGLLPDAPTDSEVSPGEEEPPSLEKPESLKSLLDSIENPFIDNNVDEQTLGPVKVDEDLANSEAGKEEGPKTEEAATPDTPPDLNEPFPSAEESVPDDTENNPDTLHLAPDVLSDQDEILGDEDEGSPSLDPEEIIDNTKDENKDQSDPEKT